MSRLIQSLLTVKQPVVCLACDEDNRESPQVMAWWHNDKWWSVTLHCHGCRDEITAAAPTVEDAHVTACKAWRERQEARS
jgi:hypothetical protein